MRVAVGKVSEHEIVIACMDFEFIGGSLGSVMGEKFSRAVDYCLKNKLALHGDQQEWRSKNDGKRIFPDATGKDKRQTFRSLAMPASLTSLF